MQLRQTRPLADYSPAHILEQLLKKGNDVVTTVRSEEKASKIRDNYPQYKDKLNVQIVPDIAKLDAFDEVVKIPGIEVVLHTASPFHFNFSKPLASPLFLHLPP